MQKIFTDCFSKRTALLVMLLFFVGGGLFSIPSHALAATTTTEQKQATIATVKAAIGMPATQVILTPADVAGLPKCSDRTLSTGILDGVCGEVASTSSNYDYTSYQKGDILKCGGNVYVMCAVTNASGTRYDYSGLGKDSVQTDLNGNIVGGDSGGLVEGAVSTAGGALANAAESVGQSVLNAVGDAILRIATFFLGIAGVLFNLVVVKTVFQFSQLIGNAPGLLLAWGILRDLGNMALLFGFIFMGLATILDLHTYNAKKALPPLIIFAVLMNFSLFAAEAIIDTSNVFSTILYSQANTAPCGSVSGVLTAKTSTLDEATASDADCSVNYGIGGSIMQASGLSTMFAIKPNQLGIASIAVYVGLALFAIIGAIVMLAASIMLVIRAVTLTLLMVFAPIGFAGMAVPPLHSLASRWWSTLIHQAFFAPLLLLLIFISLKVTEGLGGVAGDGLAGALTAPNSSTMGVILIFVIVIGFLVGSMKAATSFGAMGAAFAITAAQKIVRTPLGGIAGFAGRRTVGAGGAALQKRYEAVAGRIPLLRSNFLGIDDGIAGAFSAAQDAKFGGSRSYKEAKDHHEKRTSEFAHAHEKAELNHELDEALENGTDQDVARVLQRMSNADIEQTKYVKEGAEGIARLAQNLSPEKFEEFMKSKELGADKKDRLKEERFIGLEESLQTAIDGFAAPAGTPERAAAIQSQREIQRWSAKDFEQLAKINPNEFDRLIRSQTDSGDSIISNDQAEALGKSNVLTNQQRQDVKGQSRNGRIDALMDTAGGRVPSAADIAEAQRLMTGIGGAKNIAKLSASALRHPTIANTFSATQLAAIVTEDKLTDADRRTLAAIVQARAARDRNIANYINPINNPVAAAYFTP